MVSVIITRPFGIAVPSTPMQRYLPCFLSARQHINIMPASPTRLGHSLYLYISRRSCDIIDFALHDIYRIDIAIHETYVSIIVYEGLLLISL